jgi:hypothetical protein
MKVIITESQYKKILLEQSNVYTDKKKYDYALKIYNTLWYVYYSDINNFKKIKSFKYKDNYNFSNIENLIGIHQITPQMKNFVYSNEKIKQMYYSMWDNGKKYFVAWCKGTNGIWETKIELWKSGMTHKQQGDIFCPNVVDRKLSGFTVPIKPNILKPIFKKPEPPKPVQPTVTKPSIVQPTKPKPSLPLSTLDKTKPVDFYFGNRVLRAPDYEIAKKFAEKLALRNFNSNQVFVYKDKNNEKWFIGANDKIYFSQNSYNQDPNKNVYVDPVKMGVVFI